MKELAIITAVGVVINFLLLLFSCGKCASYKDLEKYKKEND